MSNGKLQQIIVTVPRRLEPAYTMHLRTLVGQWATSWAPAEGDRAEISLFLPARRGTTKLLRSLRAYNEILRELGMTTGPVRVRKRMIRTKDWARAWRNSFEPVRISPTLTIKPTWAKWHPRDGELVITIDPTLAFGTGHHPTTAFCLRMIERLAAKPNSTKDPERSFLDCGCGTGILAIVASRLGYLPALGFDYDLQAVRVANGNLKLNGAHRNVKIYRGAVESFNPGDHSETKRFNVVTANLAMDLLIQNAKRISGWVKPKGTLVLAGVLDRNARKVTAEFRKLGWKRICGESAGGWTSWAMKRNE